MKFALSSILVPEPSSTPDPTWTAPPADIDGSLPASADLGNNLQSWVVFPTGLGTDLRNQVATDLAVDSSLQWDTYPSVPTGDLLDPLVPGPKLIVSNANGSLLSAPLVSGTTFEAGATESKSLAIEFQLFSWKFAFGNLREKGHFGTQLLFAYRRADKGSPTFDPPPVHPYVAERDVTREVILSVQIVNLEEPLPTRRFLRRWIL